METALFDTSQQASQQQHAEQSGRSKYESSSAADVLLESNSASSSSRINEVNNGEQRSSPAAGHRQQLHQQLGVHPSLETSAQVKAAKSVLFDTRSTTHSHNRKVQSGKKMMISVIVAMIFTN